MNRLVIVGGASILACAVAMAAVLVTDDASARIGPNVDISAQELFKPTKVTNTVGIPATVEWVEVHGIYYPPPRRPPYVDYNPIDVTFELRGNKTDSKIVWDLFKRLRKGDKLRGSITVKYGLRKFVLENMTLIRYSPGLVASPEHPGTLKFSFTVSPSKLTVY